MGVAHWLLREAGDEVIRPCLVANELALENPYWLAGGLRAAIHPHVCVVRNSSGNLSPLSSGGGTSGWS